MYASVFFENFGYSYVFGSINKIMSIHSSNISVSSLYHSL